MKNILFTISAILVSFQSFSQVQLCLGDDATVCQGQTVQITNCGPTGGTVSNGIVLNNPTTIPQLWDDSWSGVIPVGFNFNFYGTNYSQCVIGSNGLVSFNTGFANGGCPWNLTGQGTLPSGNLTATRNSAMLFYSDINPSAPPIGPIKYQTIGTAPNRMFVVLFESVNAFQCANTCYYGALIFYETTNKVDMMIGQKPACSWNGGLAIQGVNSPSGATATITAGRNNSVWTANQDGRRFTPTSPTNTNAYTVATTQYVTVTSSTASNVQWANTVNATTVPYNNGVLNVTTILPGTTGYYLTAAACNASVGGLSDTTWITRVSSTVTATSTPDICSSGIGTVTANPGLGLAPFTFNWPALGATTQTVTGVGGGAYIVQMVDANGCASSTNVIVGNTPASFTGATTIVSCPGGSNGTATAAMTPPLGTVSYLWNDPAQQTTATATGLAAGTYSCTVTSTIGCFGTVNVTVTEIPGMIATVATQTDVTCNSDNDGILIYTITQGTAPYTYLWDNSVSTTNSATDLFAGVHILTITDANGCVITATETIDEPDPLTITTLTPDTQICPEDDIQLDVTGSGGSSAYTYTWSENGIIIGTGTSIIVDPLNSNTIYCVELSELCGSPTTTECTEIVFPIRIVPNITPNKLEDCTPAIFEFENSSSNGSEIATTYFEFSDGSNYMEIGADSTSNLFIIPSMYSANMTVTSIYGCVYTGSFVDLIEVKPLPTADFTFSSNPASFFETTIQLQDRSTSDVVDWYWLSPGSIPAYSDSKNPNFTFPEGDVGDYPVTLVVTTDNGCTDTLTMIMHIVQDVIFYSPNTFTPDGDEHNQSWGIYVEGIDIYDFNLYIFNRWGEMIWESHDVNAKWDGTFNGKIVSAGTYVWKADAKDMLNDGKHEFNGYINVLK